LEWGRSIFGIAFDGSLIGPGDQGSNLFGSQAAIVGEVADGGIGKPWRHFLRQHGLFHGLGPGAGVLVSEQREGRGFAGAVTLLAALLQDGQDLLIESDGGRIDVGGAQGTCDSQRGEQRAHERPPKAE